MVRINTPQVIFCRGCGEKFDPFRPMPREWMDAKRCKYCGRKHAASAMQLDPAVEKPDGRKKLYLISSGDAVKIGVSIEPEKRLDELQVGNDSELELVKTWDPEDALEAERNIHKRLLENKRQGEWFSIDDTSLNGLVDAISVFVEGLEDD